MVYYDLWTDNYVLSPGSTVSNHRATKFKKILNYDYGGLLWFTMIHRLTIMY
jgi:hypothetical protein